VETLLESPTMLPFPSLLLPVLLLTQLLDWLSFWHIFRQLLLSEATDATLLNVAATLGATEVARVQPGDTAAAEENTMR